MDIGVVGLGIIGSRMARNWQKAGHTVRGWNRTREHAEGVGIPLLDSPAAVAEASEVVMVVVGDPASLHDVISGPGGVATVSLSGKLVLNSTTVDAASNRRTATAVEVVGGEFLEVPFTGSKDGAETGKLVFYAGGREAVLSRAQPVLMQVGTRVIFFGPVGTASDVKLAMNLMLANVMQAMAEGVRFVEKAGVSMEAFVEAYQVNAGWCGLSAMKLPKLQTGDFSPHFSLKHMGKDVHLALRRAMELGTALPHTRHLAVLFDAALAQGLGDEDFSVLYRTLK
jgi:3-hydroxyisobutyrate dehydrogenase-like beta-hydroxyacid dehydrogenase